MIDKCSFGSSLRWIASETRREGDIVGAVHAASLYAGHPPEQGMRVCLAREALHWVANGASCLFLGGTHRFSLARLRGNGKER